MNHLTEIAISLGVVAFAFWRMARLRREVFRFDIRCLRDELFDFVLANGISFDDEGYIAVRRCLNGILSQSNHLSVFHLLIAVYFYKLKEDCGYSTEKPPGDLTSSKVLAAKLDQVRNAAARRVVHFLFLEGVFGYFIRAVYLVAKVFAKSKQLKNRAFNYADQLFSESYLFGRSDHHSIHYGCRAT